MPEAIVTQILHFYLLPLIAALTLAAGGKAKSMYRIGGPLMGIQSIFLLWQASTAGDMAKMSLILLFVASAVIAASLVHAELTGIMTRTREFHALAILLYFPLSAAYLSNNLGYLWFAIETATLVSAGLVYMHRDKRALEATWKYFIICSVGVALALLGTISIFASTQAGGEVGTMSFSALKSSKNDMVPTSPPA